MKKNLIYKRLQNPEFLNFVLNKIPIRKSVTSEDVASAVVFLASDEANMINCCNLTVDGVWTTW